VSRRYVPSMRGIIRRGVPAQTFSRNPPIALARHKKDIKKLRKVRIGPLRACHTVLMHVDKPVGRNPTSDPGLSVKMQMQAMKAGLDVSV
jgi:hypothetical protein